MQPLGVCALKGGGYNPDNGAAALPSRLAADLRAYRLSKPRHIDCKR